MDKTRTTLLAAIADANNGKAWGEFYDVYSPYVKAVVSNPEVGLRPDEVEDVVNIVFLEIARGKLKYSKSVGSFRALLKTNAHRRAIDQMRRRKPTEEMKTHRSPGDDRTTGTIERIPESRFDYEEREEAEWRKTILQLAVERTAKKVSREQFQIFDVAVLREWPTTRVMQTYGVTENQVYIAKSRVGKVFDEECRRVAAEIDDPAIPVKIS